jgi:hypothetical protein
MEQLYQSIVLQPAISKRYKLFMHYLINAHASFKVAHELIPYFIEFEGIDFFFRNKIEDSYMAARGHMENALGALAEVRESNYGNARAEQLDMRLSTMEASIKELMSDTQTLVRDFYANLGSEMQLNEISSIRARFSEVVYKSLELTSVMK